MHVDWPIGKIQSREIKSQVQGKALSYETVWNGEVPEIF